MFGTDFILDALAKERIDHIFMVPGGLIDPFLPAIGRQNTLTPIVAAQEGGAAYMADGYARASKKMGVALCIGGPGLTNAITAIATARTDGSPILIISGEVETAYEGIGMFQDASSQTLNDVNILKTITKYSSSIDNPKNLHHLFHHAMIHMLADPKGPVHLSLPKDCQNAIIDAVYHPINEDLLHAGTLALKAANNSLSHFTQGLNGKPAIRIAILAGSGVCNKRGAKTLLRFSEHYCIPVATTLRAKGVFPENHANSLGVFGYSGTHHSKIALLDDPPDLLIVLGSGLNERDTMHWALKLNPKHTINVNLSAFAMATHLTGSSIIGDAGTYLDWLEIQGETISKALLSTQEQRKQWVTSITLKPRLQDSQNCVSHAIPIHPARIISELRKSVPAECILVIDSGAHRAFAGHYWTSYQPFTYISATNLGPMGWAIPAAIGVKCAQPNKPVAVITGDGCMHMEGIEIATAVRYQLSIIYVVINNAAFGNVWLRLHNQGAVPDKLTSLPDIDWAAFAKALGAHGITVSDPKDLSDAFAMAQKNKGPTVIDVKADKHFASPVQDWSSASAGWSYQE